MRPKAGGRVAGQRAGRGIDGCAEGRKSRVNSSSAGLSGRGSRMQNDLLVVGFDLETRREVHVAEETPEHGDGAGTAARGSWCASTASTGSKRRQGHEYRC